MGAVTVWSHEQREHLPEAGRYLVCGTRPRALPVQSPLARALRRLGVGAEVVVESDQLAGAQGGLGVESLLPAHLVERVRSLPIWAAIYLYSFEGVVVVMPVDRFGRYLVECFEGPHRDRAAEAFALRAADRLTLTVAFRPPRIPLRNRRSAAFELARV